MTRASSVLVLGLLAVGAYADLKIPRNTVLPATFDQEVRLKSAREGTRVTAVLDENPDLPKGSVLLGSLVNVDRDPKNGGVEIRFDAVRLPAGNEVRIRAMGIPLNGAEKRNGRWVAKNTKVDKGGAVAAGAIGGFIIGSIFKKQFEGTVVGTLAGILVAETNDKANGDLVITRGTQIGARLDQDVFVDSDYRETDKNRDLYKDDLGAIRDGGDRESAGWPGQDRVEVDRQVEATATILFEDRPMTFAKGERPYVRNGVAMVPLLTMAKRLGLEVDSSGDRYYVEGPSDSLRLTLGADVYRFNGQEEEILAPVEKRNRVVFVPVQVLQEFSRNLRAEVRPGT